MAVVGLGLGLWAATAGAGARIADLRQDRVRYAPGETARIVVDVANDAEGSFRGSLRLTVRNLGDVVASFVRPRGSAGGGKRPSGRWSRYATAKPTW